MLNSLRSWLLTSYIVVIIVTLVVVTLTILAIVAQPNIRYFSNLQRLDALSRISSNEIIRLRRGGARDSQIIEVLAETAVENNVRILVVNAADVRVVYDSKSTDPWVGLLLTTQEIPNQILPSTDTNTAARTFEDPNHDIWLLYTRALTSSGRDPQLIVYAVPEPSSFVFFDELGFGSALFQAGLIALVVAFMLGLWIARSVARPLQKMADAAEAIAAGDYDQQLALQGPEEVQRVAGSFNTMSKEVSHTRNAQRDFVANVSHDLKTPITSIHGWSQALLDGTAVASDDQQHAANIIHTESARMERMVEELLDLARIESGQMVLNLEPLDLGQMLRSVYQGFQPRAQEHNIQLTLDLQPVGPIWGDHDRLLQLFSNLLDNALSYTPAQGTVHLSLRSLAEKEEKGVEVTVEDTGKGMAAKELERIFERFYQVEKSRVRANGRSGSGLGLAIAAELVHLHHGRIWAYSTVGQGSRFVVHLPVGPGAEGARPS